MGDYNRDRRPSRPARFSRDRDSSERPSFKPARDGFRGRSYSRPSGERSFSRPRGDFQEKESFRADFRRDDHEGKRHYVNCDKCGKRCAVPFKPTGNKPVYCSDCFKKDDSSGSSSHKASSEQLEQINAKLDKIMKILGID